VAFGHPAKEEAGNAGLLTLHQIEKFQEIGFHP
jgi:hypothetical protein